MSSNPYKLKTKYKSKWLLVEVSSKNGERLSGTAAIPTYIIIEKSFLADVGNSRVRSGIIKCYHDSNIFEGRVKFSSSSRKMMEKKMECLIEEARSKVKASHQMIYFLVQISKGDGNIVHAIVNGANVTRMPDTAPNEHKVLLNTSTGKQVATVLCIHTDRTYLEVEFQKLKQCCFEMLHDTTDHNLTLEKDEWILALYTHGPYDIVYTVLNNADTLSLRKNLYQDVIAYTTNGRDVYQMIVIRKSFNCTALLSKMDELQRKCLTLQFPLNIDVNDAYAMPPIGYNSYCGNLKKFRRIAGDRSDYNAEEVELKKLELNVLKEQDSLMELIDQCEKLRKIAIESVVPSKCGEKEEDREAKETLQNMDEDHLGFHFLLGV